MQRLLPSSPTVVDVSLEEVVMHYRKTAPTKRKLTGAIEEGPSSKRRKKKPEEDESQISSGEENLQTDMEVDGNIQQLN